MQDSDSCPICGGDEWVLIRKPDGTEEAIPCKCRQKNIWKRRLQFADIPAAFGGMELRSFRTDVYRLEESRKIVSAACMMIKEYLEAFDTAFSRGMGLYLYSNTKGTGKTRIAASLANELILTYDKQVKFAVSTTILNEIKHTWEKDSKYTENGLLYHLTAAEVLIIDDFGTEKITEWVMDKFYHIINERYMNGKVTIFTSNECVSNLRYDERIISRIKERTYQIQFPEESVRDYIAEKNSREILQRVCS